MIDPSKLKVVELRSELAKRGLDQKGNKPVLIARLKAALEEDEEEEEEEVGEEQCIAEESAPEVQDENPLLQDEVSAQSVQSSEAGVAPEEDSSLFLSQQDESESKQESEVIEQDSLDVNETKLEDDESKQESEVIEQDSLDVNETKPEDDESKQESEVIEQDSLDVNETKPEDDESLQSVPQNEDSTSQQQSEDQPEESMDTWQQQNQNEDESDVSYHTRDNTFHVEDSNAQDVMDTDEKYYKEESEKSQSETDDKSVTATNDAVEDKKVAESEVVIKTQEEDEKQDIVEEKIQAPDTVDIKIENNIVKVEGEEKPVTERRERKNRWDDGVVACAPPVKRKRSPSPEHEKAQSFVPRKVENEPEIDDNAVTLSWYDSDLHLEIDTASFVSAVPFTQAGFGYVWAGARSSYGFEQGKVYYELKVMEYIEVKDLEDEPNPNVVRCGWSVHSRSLQLGEDPLSYGYGGTGKISTDCKFQDYGKPFIVGDVVGCYLDLDSDPIKMSFSVNGEDQGVAFSVQPEDVKGKPLFPHVLSKNCKFQVNFGQEDAWSTILPDYVNVGKVELAKRISGPKRPEKREDCEVIMLCGLPACGKTTWAEKYAEEHEDKLYNILGTNTLIDKMKVMGLPRKRNYAGRWEGLIQKCTKCLNKLLEVAYTRRRNYIIDQTNVYPSAQRRKMRGFEGFNRRAVVIVPTDEELKSRTAKREKEEGKDVPDSAVFEMKANFGLPEQGDLFNEVIYVELDEAESKKLVSQYNKEGSEAGYLSAQSNKRFRPDDRQQRRDYRSGSSGSGGGGGGGNWRDRGYNNNNNRYNDRGWSGGQRSGGGGGGGGMRGGPPRGMGMGGGGGGGGGGGWRDRYGGGSGGGGWRGSGGRYNDRDRDSRSDRSRDRRDSGGKSMRDRSSSGGSGGGGSDRGDKRMQSRQDNQGWGNQQNQQQMASGYGQQANWSQGYANQGWGNWGQGYNQTQQQNAQAQQWKGYQQQNWGQGWGQQQNWGQWNQQYYNQAYQQGWGQAAMGTANATAATTTAGGQAANTGYGAYGQNTTAGVAGTAQAATGWAGYGTAATYTTGSSTVNQTAVTYTPTQKQ